MKHKFLFLALFIIPSWLLAAEEDLSSLLKEKASFAERQETVNNQIKDKLTEIMPKGKLSYGEFSWSAEVTKYSIILKAKDSNEKLQIQAELKYYLDVPENYRNGYANTCSGYPAKRFKNKWAWVLLGNTEIRLTLRNESLETDETIDAIIGSFDLKLIEKL